MVDATDFCRGFCFPHSHKDHTMKQILGFGTLAAAMTLGIAATPITVTAQQTASGQTATGQQAKTQEKRPDIYDEKVDAAKQIEEALANAKRNNTRVLVQWGANWCGWCHILHDTMKSDRTLARTIMYEYEVVLVDVGRFDKNLELAEKLGADFKGNGVPYLTILSSDGKPVLSQETSSFENKVDGKSGHDAAKLDKFLQEHRAPYLSAESVLSEALRDATEDNKLVFLHFGAPWCGWCHRLENWAHTPEVEKILGKDFIDVKIDIDRMIGGKAVQDEYREGAGGGIPWFAFVNGKGEVVATSDVNGQNLGCPWTDEEKAAFRKVLAKVAKNAKPKELDAIVAKLGPQDTEK